MAQLRFSEATALTPGAGPGTFDADIDGIWGVGGNANGGYLMAILARAAMAATGSAFTHSIAASFLSPGHDGPAEVRTDVLRRGRTATFVRASLHQQDRTLLDATLVVGPTPTGDPEVAVAMSTPPPVELCIPAKSAIVTLLERITVDHDPATNPLVPGEPVVRAWVALREPEKPDPLLALLACDALVPSVHRIGHTGWAPTVQLTALVHAVPAPGPLAVECRLGEVRDGWWDEEMTVADTTGRLIARARQLARLPRPA
ncbi:MAG: thioesterase family protein [Sporichthyaceae bacterium]